MGREHDRHRDGKWQFSIVKELLRPAGLATLLSLALACTAMVYKLTSTLCE